MELGSSVSIGPAELQLEDGVALESHRARAVIVGEDLGTVENEARAELMSRRVLSYRLVWFEKASPSPFPEEALAAAPRTTCRRVAGL